MEKVSTKFLFILFSPVFNDASKIYSHSRREIKIGTFNV